MWNPHQLSQRPLESRKAGINDCGARSKRGGVLSRTSLSLSESCHAFTIRVLLSDPFTVPSQIMLGVPALCSYNPAPPHFIAPLPGFLPALKIICHPMTHGLLDHEFNMDRARGSLVQCLAQRLAYDAPLIVFGCMNAFTSCIQYALAPPNELPKRKWEDES